jgi:hypothetical protein
LLWIHNDNKCEPRLVEGKPGVPIYDDDPWAGSRTTGTIDRWVKPPGC